MVSSFLCLGVAASLVALSSAANADSLGFRFADITVGGVADGNGFGAVGRLSGDFALTEAHGLQLDLGVASYGHGFLGQIDAHLYMMPSGTAKYGVFVSLADIDGREATIGMVGVEAMIALSDRSEIHGRAAIGMAMPGNMDFVTGSFGASYAVSNQISVFGDVTLAEFDEALLRAVGTSARLGASFQPEGQAWEVSASLVRNGLTGRDAAAFETRAEVGVTWHLGAGGGAKRKLPARSFANTQPFDPLLRRGMF